MRNVTSSLKFQHSYYIDKHPSPLSHHVLGQAHYLLAHAIPALDRAIEG